MYSYKAKSIDEALSVGLEHLLEEGIPEDSRVGPVLVAPGPVCIEYTEPRNRVLFSPTRDGNCVFHFMETLWMLSGSNELEFPVFFNASYAQFSDDGSTMWDSYGWRWKEFFGYDQLEAIIAELKSNPGSRRCVLAMWNAEVVGEPFLILRGVPYRNDLGVACNGGKAVPCNTHAYFAMRDGKLRMTVMNRSNDAMWGCYGANAVHFSLLLEYMAMRIGVPMGSYFQFTNNLHTYTDKFSVQKLNLIADESLTISDEAYPELGPAVEEGFDDDLKLFMPWALEVIRSQPLPDLKTEAGKLMMYPTSHVVLNVPACKTAFFHSVVVPMFLFWVYRKWKDEYSSNTCLDGIDAPDWQRACQEWVDRRKK